VVVLGHTGEVEMASDEGLRWLEEVEVRPALRVAVLGLRSSDVGQVTLQVRSARGTLAPVTFVRLLGRMGDRFLATPLDVATAQPTPDTTRRLLTPAQRAVSDLLLTGATLAEIADALGVSAETVKSHTKNIYARLGVGSRVELARALANE
jgi:DNA-binding CsgD family transcriptional regulator